MLLDNCSWLHCFPSLSLCPKYPRLVFLPTFPIILDVITHYNVTHKGKLLLCLEIDLCLTSCTKSLFKVSLRTNKISNICAVIVCSCSHRVFRHMETNISTNQDTVKYWSLAWTCFKQLAVSADTNGSPAWDILLMLASDSVHKGTNTLILKWVKAPIATHCNIRLPQHTQPFAALT